MNTTDRTATARRFLELAVAGKAREGSAQLVTSGFRHHNVYFAGDGASLFKAMDDNAAQFPGKTLEVMQVVQDGDKVVTLCKVQHAPDQPTYAVTHFFRFEDGKIAELWDMGQEIPKESPNRYGAF